MRDMIISAILGFLLFLLVASGYQLVKESLPIQKTTSTEVQQNIEVVVSSSFEEDHGGPRKHKKHNKPKKHRHHIQRHHR